MRTDLGSIEQAMWAAAYVSKFDRTHPHHIGHGLDEGGAVDVAEQHADHVIDAWRLRENMRKAERATAAREAAETLKGVACDCFIRTNMTLSDEWTTKRGIKHHFNCPMYTGKGKTEL
jgi:hypothetical protein